MIVLRTQPEIERIRAASRIVAETLEKVREMLAPGISTLDIDNLVRDYVISRGGSLLFYNYKGFPANSCISINEEVVHGIASQKRALKRGDIVALDVTGIHQGYIGDNACTVRVGEVEPEVERLLRVTEDALYEGIRKARAGLKVSDISRAIQRYVESRGMSVVREFVGHGVGRSMHEEPQIPNFVQPGVSPKLQAGMTLAIEPMVNLGRPEVEVLPDGWTVVARDRRPSAHFEHTVLVTNGDPEILTVPAHRSVAAPSR